MIKVKNWLFKNLKWCKWPIFTCVNAKNALLPKVGPLFGPCGHVSVDKMEIWLNQFGLDGLNLAIFTKNSKVLKFWHTEETPEYLKKNWKFIPGSNCSRRANIARKCPKHQPSTLAGVLTPKKITRGFGPSTHGEHSQLCVLLVITTTASTMFKCDQHFPIALEYLPYVMENLWVNSPQPYSCLNHWLRTASRNLMSWATV